MKSRQKSIVLGIATCFALALAPCAWGDTFNNPPESGPDPWQTPFPYQRNIMLDFSTNPVGPTGPIPGAVYEGHDDPVLWGSDSVQLGGGATWDSGTESIVLPPNNGFSGGTITLHLDNWERMWPLKHFYMEYTLSAGASYSIDLTVPPGYSMTGYTMLLEPIWREWQPNPPWEEVTFTNIGYDPIYLDNLHVATECVPVPGAVLLGVLGLGAAGLKLRRLG